MPLDPTRTLEYFQDFGRDTFPQTIGFRLTGVAEGRLTSELEVLPGLMAPNGYLHAATVVGLADTTAGCATIAHLPVGAKSFTTIELKCNFLGTATEGKIVCVCTAAHLGRTTQVWDATVSTAGSDKTIALFRCTQMILWPR